jgi:hypothetical protein
VAAEVRFLPDGEAIAVDAPDASASVLDLLRYCLRRSGPPGSARRHSNRCRRAGEVDAKRPGDLLTPLVMGHNEP